MARATNFMSTVDLDARVAALRDELNSLKLTKQTFGASNLAIKQVWNGDIFEYDIVGANIGPLGETGFRVTFIYDVAKKPYSDLMIDWTVTGAPGYLIDVDIIPDTVNQDITTLKSWIVRVVNYHTATATVSLKPIVRCQDDGELTIEEIYSI